MSIPYPFQPIYEAYCHRHDALKPDCSGTEFSNMGIESAYPVAKVVEAKVDEHQEADMDNCYSDWMSQSDVHWSFANL